VVLVVTLRRATDIGRKRLAERWTSTDIRELL